jgi:hypothetical protein
MQKRQFLVAIRRYRRWALLTLYGLFACLWLVTFILIPAGLRRVPETTLNSHSTRPLLFYAGCIAMIFGLVLVQSKLFPRIARKCSLVCPSCHKPISVRAFAELGYTGTCSECGGEVFDKQPSTKPRVARSEQISKVQFHAAIHSYRRDIQQKSKQVAAIAFVPIAVGLSIFGLSSEPMPLRRIILGVLAIGGLFASLGYSLFAKRRAGLFFGLACPCCRNRFNDSELTALGYSETCPKCGEHIFD